MARSAFTKAEETFVSLARVARVATVSTDGTPHVVPICPLLHEGLLYFATGESRKTRNIRATSKVCIVFDEYQEDWDSLQQVLVFGAAHIIDGGSRFQELRDLFYAKFPQYPIQADGIEELDSVIVGVEIGHISSDGLSDD